MDKNTIVVDATDVLVGRMGTFVAREALHGKTIKIINCENAAISGKRREIIADWKRFADMGTPKKGPFVHRMPDRMVRRMIRGMLPYKQPRGRDAFERIMCFIGTPSEFKDAKVTVMPDNSKVGKLPSVKFIRVGEICKELGGKTYGSQ